MEQFHLGSHGCGNGVELLIGGDHADDLVAGFHQGVEQMVVGPRRPVGRNHLVRGESPVQLADPLF